jgi:hypothetical protein
MHSRNAPCTTVGVAEPVLRAFSLSLNSFMLLKVCASINLLHWYILIRTGRRDDRAVEKLRWLQALMVSLGHHVIDQPVAIYTANVCTNIAWGYVDKLHG